jgi:hypothetical protein
MQPELIIPDKQRGIFSFDYISPQLVIREVYQAVYKIGVNNSVGSINIKIYVFCAAGTERIISVLFMLIHNVLIFK